MARLVRLTPAYARNYQRLTSSPETRRKVNAAVRALAEAETLPGPDDEPGPMPPVGYADVRRLPGLALWLWYTATADTLTLRALTAAPPQR